MSASMLPCGTRTCSGASTSTRTQRAAAPGVPIAARSLRRGPTTCRTATVEEAQISDEKRDIQKILDRPYKYGFKTIIESDTFPKGLNEDVVRAISAKKGEPEWMLEFRLKAFRKWLTMEEPKWSDNAYPEIDYQDVSYYSEPKFKEKLESLDQVDPELLKTFEKLGIPLNEQKRLSNVAVDAVFDSVSIATTFKADLLKHGVIFCSISEALKDYPEMVRKYMGSVVPRASSAQWSCPPTSASTPARPASLSAPSLWRRRAPTCRTWRAAPPPRTTTTSCTPRWWSCTATKTQRSNTAPYRTGYAGDVNGKGGIYNFVTKRGLCSGSHSKISWTQVETGSSITWKYPSVVLAGDNSVGEFYSVALTNNRQQADTGTKMIHVGRNTRSRIVSKGISAGNSRNCYRGLVQVQPSARGARNFSQCDSMLIGDNAAANTYPYIQVREPSAVVEHEASTSKISEDQLFYFQQRGIDPEKAVGAIISGFCREVFNELPLEFAAEVNELMSLKLEGTVG
eukprot:XP_001700714.1 iron-sulfur cluster assembly protein [Chlamydomonas reinhardtii]